MSKTKTKPKTDTKEIPLCIEDDVVITHTKVIKDYYKIMEIDSNITGDFLREQLLGGNYNIIQHAIVDFLCYVVDKKGKVVAQLSKEGQEIEKDEKEIEN